MFFPVLKGGNFIISFQAQPITWAVAYGSEYAAMAECCDRGFGTVALVLLKFTQWNSQSIVRRRTIGKWALCTQMCFRTRLSVLIFAPHTTAWVVFSHVAILHQCGQISRLKFF